MLDEFIWGKVSRISPEAPVPVVNVISESYYPGGGANVARNVREFTGAVAMIGPDRRRTRTARGCWRLLEECGIDTAGVQQDPCPRDDGEDPRRGPQSTGGPDRPRAQRARIATEQTQRGHAEHRGRPSPGQMRSWSPITAKASSPSHSRIRSAGRRRRHRKMLAIDPHPYTSAVLAGRDRDQAESRGGVSRGGTSPVGPRIREPWEDEPLLEAGRRLLETWQTENLIITLGEDGMLVLQSGAPPYHTPARAKEVFDVSGAGDTAISVLTLAFCAGATVAEAAELANVASGIAVGKVGTATVTAEELQAELRRPEC